jgi:hypothetical protein
MGKSISFVVAILLAGGMTLSPGFARAAEGAGSSDPMSVSASDPGVVAQAEQAPDQGAPSPEAPQAGASAADAESEASAAGDQRETESDEETEKTSGAENGTQDEE